MKEQLALLPEYLTAHLRLSLLALGAGVLTSLPLGVLAHRSPALERGLLGFASVVQTVPSLALLAIMVPALSALGQSGIGFLPAFIGLSLYSLLPMLRNTVTGLAGIDPALMEAARGVGMTPGQRLWRVELPLALPVIIAGVRTATVWTVGTATLSTPVGATSLGNYIFSGLQTRNISAVLVGCVAAASLALLLDGLVRALAVAVEQRRAGLRRVVLAVIALLYLFVGVGLARETRGASRGRVTIGAKSFTEQYVLAEIMAGQVRSRAGLEAEVLSSLGSTVAFDALSAGEIDAYVDYSGTIWATVMHRESTPGTRGSVLREVRRYLEQERGLAVAGALGFENTYALAMRRDHAASLGVSSISELSLRSPGLSLGADFDFFARKEWPDLVEVYGLGFRERRSMDSALMYQAVAQGAVDVITAYSTDGRIEAYDLVVLEDDAGAIPPYDALILASRRLAEEQPGALAALRDLAGRIDAGRMRALNARVDRDGETPAAAAAGFLAELRSAER